MICPVRIAAPMFNKEIDGKPYGELRIPKDAYPAGQAAVNILDRVAENKGTIIVPEEPLLSIGKNTLWENKSPV